MPYTEIVIILLLILLNGIFSMSELAIVSAKKVHLKRLADEGKKSARIALELAEDTGKFLPTVQIGITLIGILSGAFSGATMSDNLTLKLESFGLAQHTAEVISVTSIVVVITYLTLIIGELVPKELALRAPERFALLAAPIIYLLSRITMPLVHLLNISTSLVLRLIGAGQKPLTTVTEEEVRSMIEEGTEHGLFHKTERDMISGVMLLADKPIRAFMMPRVDVITVDVEASLEDMRALMAEHPYSCYPVMQDMQIIGIIQTKEILNHVLAGNDWSVKALAQDVPTFPETAPTLKVIERLRNAPSHMAIIADEHGSFDGLVTLADLVEVITGELYGTGSPTDEAVQREDGSWLMDAGILLDIAFENIGLPKISEDRDYYTLAGFILHEMAYIPKAADYFDYKGYRFEVVDMDGIRIDKVMILRLAEDTL